MTGRQPRLGWVADLTLGARLVFAGGRNGLLRTLLIAVGVGLGVAMLLTSASIPTMLAMRQERTAARDDLFFEAAPPPGDRTLLVATTDTAYRGHSIRGRLVQPEGAHPPVPPGLTRLPGPGEMVVSPALARLLDSPDGALLRPRLAHPVVGTISAEGLAGPSEYAYYLGTDQLRPELGARRIDHFGSEPVGRGLDPVLTLLVTISFVALLLPVAVFVAAAVRFGGEARDRRLAALRLVGADAATTRRVAAGEALVGAAFGLLVGAVLFLVGRRLVEYVSLEGISVFAGDVRPSPVLTVLIALAVPAVAVMVAQVALRRIVVEPLGVIRRARGRRRRLWWRLALPVVGAALLAPLDGRAANATGTASQVQVITGTVFLLTGVAALLPWLVEAVVRRLRGGGVPWQLAIRRLQLDTESAARMVGGIAVAVAGGIALQMFFANVQHNYVLATGHDVDRAQAVVTLEGQNLAGTDLDALTARFRDIAGVERVVTTLVTGVTAADATPDDDGLRPLTRLRIGDCAALREFAVLDRCADGDVFQTVPSEESGSEESGSEESGPDSPDTAGEDVARPGQRMEIVGAGPAPGVAWTVPDRLRVVPYRPDPSGAQSTAVLATPGALDLGRLRALDAEMFLALDPTRPDTIELVRNAAAEFGPLGQVMALHAAVEADRFTQIRRGLFLGVVATLLLLGASMLVSVLEQLRERRRVLAVLVAFGTRRATLGWSVLWQTAVPVLLGQVLAVALGTALGAILLAIVDEPAHLDWPSVAGMSGLAAAVVVLVTAASLPTLWRLLRPDGLRTE